MEYENLEYFGYILVFLENSHQTTVDIKVEVLEDLTDTPFECVVSYFTTFKCERMGKFIILTIKQLVEAKFSQIVALGRDY